MNLRIGSRGSQLALWQANHVADQLRAHGHSVEIEIIKTTGDRMQEVPFQQVGSKSMFTKEIEDALAEDRIHLAVHSLKDLPTDLPEPFVLAATPPRADPRDVFVSVHHASLASLPPGATVGTSSLRRRAQLLSVRSDLQVIEFRGNVDTRLRKLAEGPVDAILLAAAGLDRLERTELIRQRLDPAEFCPAPGQGALAIETRKDDDATIAAIAFLNHSATRFAVTAERAALATLGGGCQVPIGVHCRPLLTSGRVPPVPVSGPGIDVRESMNQPGEHEIFAIVAAPDSGAAIRIYHRAGVDETDPVALGRLAADALLKAGAAPLLAAAEQASR